MTKCYVVTTPAGRIAVRAHSIRQALRRAGLAGNRAVVVRCR